MSKQVSGVIKRLCSSRQVTYSKLVCSVMGTNAPTNLMHNKSVRSSTLGRLLRELDNLSPITEQEAKDIVQVILSEGK